MNLIEAANIKLLLVTLSGRWIMTPPLIDTETMIQEVVFHILGEVDTDLADYNTTMVDMKFFFF